MTVSTDTTVIAAHPDDAELWCGATIVAISDAGGLVRLVIAAQGRNSSERDLRREESVAAAAVLGVKDIVFLDNWNGQVDANRAKIQILPILNELGDGQVFSHFPLDRHPDHTAVGVAVLYAYTELALENPAYLFVTSESYGYADTVVFEWPTERKAAALAKHESQGFDTDLVTGVETFVTVEPHWRAG